MRIAGASILRWTNVSSSGFRTFQIRRASKCVSDSALERMTDARVADA